MNNAAKIIGATGLAGLLALSASAAEPGAETAPIVSPAESTVLPNAPEVGDKPANRAPKAAPPAAGAAKGGTEAAAAGNPDWPCVQRRVPTISPAQIWDGPQLEDVKGSEDDEKIGDLTTYLQSRRISLEDAEKAVKEYAESLPAGERDKKLTQLFASLLAKVNADRTFVMGRIEEFQRRQQARAKEIEREGQKLTALNQVIPAEEQLGPRDTKLTPEQQEYNWNARIFQERQQNLTVACDIPVLIEQRVYEIARIIRAQMSG